MSSVLSYNFVALCSYYYLGTLLTAQKVALFPHTCCLSYKHKSFESLHMHKTITLKYGLFSRTTGIDQRKNFKRDVLQGGRMIFLNTTTFSFTSYFWFCFFFFFLNKLSFLHCQYYWYQHNMLM